MGFILKLQTKGGKLRIGIGLVAVAVLGAAFLLPASGAVGRGPVKKTILVTGKGRGLQFGPHKKTTIPQGGLIRFHNTSDEPHTLSIVKAKYIPHTPGEIRGCFSGGICGAVANAHTSGPPDFALTHKVVRAGKRGFDTRFTLKKKGDSTFVGPHGIDREKVTAPVGTTLYYMCVIHPWMDGKIAVR